MAGALVLDSGAVTMLAAHSPRALALLRELRHRELWPPLVPSVVLVECLSGRTATDVLVSRLVAACDIEERISTARAHRAATLRHAVGRGSAVDALVVAAAEPVGTVLTGDRHDLGALAAHAVGVTVEAL